jgi:hypothetical protein
LHFTLGPFSLVDGLILVHKKTTLKRYMRYIWKHKFTSQTLFFSFFTLLPLPLAGRLPLTLLLRHRDVADFNFIILVGKLTVGHPMKDKNPYAICVVMDDDTSLKHSPGSKIWVPTDFLKQNSF